MKDGLRLLRRIAITVAGVVVLAIGVVLLVTPGPGILVILLAMVLFAIEYEWARRRLNTLRARAQSAAEKAATNRVATTSTVIFGVGAVGLGATAVFTDFLPLSSVGTGIGVALSGLIVLATAFYAVREVHRERPPPPGGPSPSVDGTMAGRSSDDKPV